MGRPLYSTTISPIYKRGDFIGGKYTVIEAQQISRARSVAVVRQVDSGRKLMIAISQQRRVDRLKLAVELNFYSTSASSERLRYFMPVEGVFKDHVDSFVVMLHSDVSLHAYLTQRHAMLSKQRIKEIMAQLFRATEYIHSEGLVHTDICPTNVIFTRPFAQQTRYGITSGNLSSELSLVSSEIRLSFYGDTRNEGTMVGSDRYRSPEVIAGLSVDMKTDLFSLGCIMAEMALDGALFCNADRSRHYVRDCLLMMQCIIRSFESPQIEEIKRAHPSIFDRRGVIQLDGTVNQEITYFLWNNESIDRSITDRHIRDVVVALVQLQPRERVPARNILNLFSLFRRS